MKAITLTMTAQQHEELRAFLFPPDGKEAVAIALCSRSDGTRRHRLLVRELICIPYTDCLERTPVSVKWSTDSLVPALERAEQKKLSIIKIHSHRTAHRKFSDINDTADEALMPAVHGWLEADMPHGSAVMLPNGQLFGRYYAPGRASFTAIERIMVVGNDIHIWHGNTSASKQQSFAASHAQLFGEKTVQELQQLCIAVIGCSGTGGPVIEQLVRLGVGELVLVDPDRMSDRNLNRIPNTYMDDARRQRFKVDVLAERIANIGLGTKVVPIAKSLWTPEAVREVSQADIAFGCMDTVDGRFLLNTLATHYLLPYFDLGVRLEAIPEGPRTGEIREVCGTVHYLQPGRSSLISRGLVNMQQVAAAGLARNDPEAYQQQLKDGYITGVQENRPAVITVNMYIASLAVHEFLSRLHPYREEPNSNYASLEFSLRSMEFFPEPEGEPCNLLSPYVGFGDRIPLLGLPELS
ncbi:MAG TPA: ThiF family adenylyltransferase [Candidatus Obscuribacterales bacterium]